MLVPNQKSGNWFKPITGTAVRTDYYHKIRHFKIVSFLKMYLFCKSKHTYAMVYVSEDNLHKSVLSFHDGDPRD